jgi:hypothetical protein
LRQLQASARPILAWNSPQRLKESYDRDIDVSLAFGSSILRLELSALSIQQRQEVDHALAVSQPGDIGCAFAFLRL